MQIFWNSVLVLTTSIVVCGCASVQLVAEPQPGGNCPKVEGPLLNYMKAQTAMHSPTAALQAERFVQGGYYGVSKIARTPTQTQLLARTKIGTEQHQVFAQTTPPWVAQAGSLTYQNSARAEKLGLTLALIDELVGLVPDAEMAAFTSTDLTPAQKADADMLWAMISNIAPSADNLSRVVASGNTQPVTFNAFSASRSTGKLLVSALKGYGAQALEVRTREQTESAVLDVIEFEVQENVAKLAGNDTFSQALNKKKIDALELAATRNAEHSTAVFLKAYIKAYFHDGHPLTITLDISKGVNRLIDELKKNPILAQLDTGTVTNVATQVVQGWCDTTTTTCSVATPGKNVFVSRSGASLSSEELGYDGTWHHLELAKEAPALIRVATEAIFDARVPHVPAAATSTACVQKLYDDDYCLTDVSEKKYPGLKDAIATVDADASRSDSLSGALAGVIIRGGWLIATNNEAVSNSIENLIGVLARKESERVSWQNLTQNNCSKDLPRVSWSVN